MLPIRSNNIASFIPKQSPKKKPTSIHKKAAHQKGRLLRFLVILHRDVRVAPVVSRPTDSPHEKGTAAVRSGLVVEFLVVKTESLSTIGKTWGFWLKGGSMRKVFGHVFCWGFLSEEMYQVGSVETDLRPRARICFVNRILLKTIWGHQFGNSQFVSTFCGRRLPFFWPDTLITSIIHDVKKLCGRVDKTNIRWLCWF